MGATFDWVFDQTFEPRTNWYIDGVPVPAQTGETATHKRLTLEFRVQTDVLRDTVRQLKSDQGKTKTLVTDDGGFTAVDRANGGNSFTLSPPDARKPLRQEGVYHVRTYEESLVSQTAEEWQVEVEFVKDENRTDSPSINEGANGAVFDWTFDQTFGGGEWGFDTRYGSIATERVDAEFAGTGDDGVVRYEITGRLTFDQSHAFEAALARVDGTRIKQVPDAPNQPRDETNDDANTISISSPDSDTLSSGEYVLIEPFESERLNDAYQQVSFTVAPL